MIYSDVVHLYTLIIFDNGMFLALAKPLFLSYAVRDQQTSKQHLRQ